MALREFRDKGATVARRYFWDDRSVGPAASQISGGVGDAVLSDAIRQTLAAPAAERVAIFEQLARAIEVHVAETCPEHPWTCQIYDGVDGSRIFRGGVGASLVIDPAGRLWRARNYEDFETTYRIANNACEIETLRPLYSQMHEYLPR